MVESSAESKDPKSNERDAPQGVGRVETDGLSDYLDQKEYIDVDPSSDPDVQDGRRTEGNRRGVTSAPM